MTGSILVHIEAVAEGDCFEVIDPPIPGIVAHAVQKLFDLPHLQTIRGFRIEVKVEQDSQGA